MNLFYTIHFKRRRKNVPGRTRTHKSEVRTNTPFTKKMDGLDSNLTKVLFPIAASYMHGFFSQECSYFSWNVSIIFGLFGVLR